MEIETIIDKTVEFFINQKNQDGLRFDDEYQRAATWTTFQKQMFIDSILRGYSIPAFYFYLKGHFQPAGEDTQFPKYDVVDGQQRIRAIQEFREDGFDLLDPDKKDDFKFPNFVQGEQCDWRGQPYSRLDANLKEKFLKQKIIIFEIKTDNKDKVRDLFIRLQGGTPLTAQDKRDAWPGQFTKYILQIAGKSALNKEEGRGTIGWPFFREIVGHTDPRKKRTLAAQLVMIYFQKIESNQQELVSIKSHNIDKFYHHNIDFDDNNETARDFRKILEKLTHLIGNRAQKLKGHEAIHLILLVDLLTQGYTSSWEDHLLEAFIQFRKRCKLANNAKKENKESEYENYWKRYHVWTRSSSDDGATIARRHEFFLDKMLELLSPHLKNRDPKRIFGDIEREIIYERDKQQCQWCKMKNESHTVLWNEAEFHHIEPHRKGGITQIENGALMHEGCHPKGNQNETKFKEWWLKEKESNTHEDSDGQKRKLTELPDETKCRFVYKGREYLGQITKGKIYLNHVQEEFKSLTAASNIITNTSSNGWRDWQIFLPEKDMWVIAGDWRQGLDL